MQVYLVGGAVRDQLLGRAVGERDWVVVGATPDELERLGYKPVGRDFPVFLHPDTREEYALARLERKTGPGYRGFVTHSSADVTLEQDLQRRDLTINAMAQSVDGSLIDPYGGRRDIEQRWLRHVSAAFVEDPVRILRLARFAARFAPLGFRVAPDTLELMRSMVTDGEVDALVPERVWREMQRALGEVSPESFFAVLQECAALTAVLPGMIWNAAALEYLKRAATLSDDPEVRFAAVLLPSGTDSIGSLCQQLRVPVEYRDLALLAARLADEFAAGGGLSAEAALDLIEAADALRRPPRWHKLALVMQAAGRLDTQRAQLLRQALEVAQSVRLPAEQQAALQGPAIAAAMRRARLQQLQSLF